MDSTKIKAVEIHGVKIHNTLAMALAAEEWVNKNDPTVTRINICTWDTHGRKTWIAFKRAFGKTRSVGIYYRPLKKKTLHRLGRTPVVDLNGCSYVWPIRSTRHSGPSQ